MAIARKPSRIAYSVVVWPSSRSRSSTAAICSRTKGRIRSRACGGSSSWSERRRRRSPRLTGQLSFDKARSLPQHGYQWGGCGLDGIRLRRPPALAPSSGDEVGRRRLRLLDRSERSPSRPSLRTVALVFFAVLWTSAFIVFSAGCGAVRLGCAIRLLSGRRGVLAGDSPYPALDDPILEDQKGYVYPPQLAVGAAAVHVATDRSRRPDRRRRGCSQCSG